MEFSVLNVESWKSPFNLWRSILKIVLKFAWEDSKSLFALLFIAKHPPNNIYIRIRFRYRILETPSLSGFTEFIMRMRDLFHFVRFYGLLDILWCESTDVITKWFITSWNEPMSIRCECTQKDALQTTIRNDLYALSRVNESLTKWLQQNNSRPKTQCDIIKKVVTAPEIL